MAGAMESASCLTQLERVFGQYAAEIPGMRVEVVGHLLTNEAIVHPVAGFEVSLTRGDATTSLYLSESYAELTLRFDHPDSSDVGFRQSFTVRLSDEYHWGGTSFPNAEELAHALLGYMQFQLDAATEPVA